MSAPPDAPRRPGGVLVALAALAALAVLALGLGACTPESLHPLSEQTRLPPDKRLIGTWHAELLGNAHTAVVTEAAGLTLDVELTSATLDGGTGAAPTTSRHVLSFHSVNGVPVIVEKGPSLLDGEPVYRYAAYRVGADGAVTLDYIGNKGLGGFVWSHRLGSEIRSSDPLFQDVLLTAPPEEIVGFMRQVPAERMYTVPFGPFTRR